MCSSEDCTSQYSVQSLSQSSLDMSGVTANLRDRWALSCFIGEKAKAQKGEAFRPKATHGALRQALRSADSKFSVLSSPPPFHSKHSYFQPTCHLPQFHFSQKLKWNESWDLG